jgi:hypothetical protein
VAVEDGLEFEWHFPAIKTAAEALPIVIAFGPGTERCDMRCSVIQELPAGRAEVSFFSAAALVPSAGSYSENNQRSRPVRDGAAKAFPAPSMPPASKCGTRRRAHDPGACRPTTDEQCQLCPRTGSKPSPAHNKAAAMCKPVPYFVSRGALHPCYQGIGVRDWLRWAVSATPRSVAPYSAIIANVHSEPPVGTAPPMARRARPPPKPEATVTYCRPLCA